MSFFVSAFLSLFGSFFLCSFDNFLAHCLLACLSTCPCSKCSLACCCPHIPKCARFILRSPSLTWFAWGWLWTSCLASFYFEFLFAFQPSHLISSGCFWSTSTTFSLEWWTLLKWSWRGQSRSRPQGISDLETFLEGDLMFVVQVFASALQSDKRPLLEWLHFARLELYGSLRPGMLQSEHDH